MHWKRKYDNYNCSAFYESSYVIARAYQNGRFSFGGRDEMKKKIALVITIAVCIVSVSANVYQYRVIQNKKRVYNMEPKGCGSDVSGGTGIHRGSDDSIKQV